jgi:tetratricopeptide (TPR) repeat protein
MSILRAFRRSAAAWAAPRQSKDLNFNKTQQLMDARNWAEAEAHLADALKGKHPDRTRGELLAQLAQAQSEQGKLEDAAQTARAAVDLARKNPSALWDALDRLAAVQLKQKDTGATLGTLASMDLDEKARDRPDVARLLHASRQRGSVLLGVGRAAEARAAFEESIKLTEQTYGLENVETANFLAELGALCCQTGCHPEAQQYLQRALKIYRGNPEYDMLQTSKSLRYLALSMEESGDLEAATAECERLVSFWERQVGSNGKELVSAQVHLSGLYVQTGRRSAARELLGPAIALLERTKGEPLRDALFIMAVAEEHEGRHKEAAVYREKAERIFSSVVPSGVPSVIATALPPRLPTAIPTPETPQ